MGIDVTCQCGKAYNVSGTLAGQAIRCKVCGAPMRVPATQSTRPRFADEEDDSDPLVAIDEEDDDDFAVTPGDIAKAGHKGSNSSRDSAKDSASRNAPWLAAAPPSSRPASVAPHAFHPSPAPASTYAPAPGTAPLLPPALPGANAAGAFGQAGPIFVRILAGLVLVGGIVQALVFLFLGINSFQEGLPASGGFMLLGAVTTVFASLGLFQAIQLFLKMASKTDEVHALVHKLYDERWSR